MRTLSIFLFIVLIGFKSFGQVSGDCRTAIPVCADTPVLGILDGRGDIDDFDPDVVTVTGCLEKGSVDSANIENDNAWFVFRAGTDGELGFDIEALPSPGNTITAELDFALYGPFDQTLGDNFCTTISSGTLEPIRCNYEVNNTGYTGLGVNPFSGQAGAPNLIAGSGNTYDEFINVTAGEVYYLFINNFNTNFSGDNESFILNFTGSSVDQDQNNALDCTLRDEFLGFDIIACEGDPDIVLSALNSPAGPNVNNITWEVDFEDDGVIDSTLATGAGATEYTVVSPTSGRYFVTIDTDFGQVTDDILITFYGIPQLDQVVVIDDFVNSLQTDPYNVRFEVLGDGDFEYAINGGEFQDDPTFLDVPPGVNTVIINDKTVVGQPSP